MYLAENSCHQLLQYLQQRFLFLTETIIVYLRQEVVIQLHIHRMVDTWNHKQSVTTMIASDI